MEPEPEKLPPPESDSAPALPPARERNIALGGILLVLAGLWFLIANFLPGFDGGQGIVLVVGIAFLLAYFLGNRKAGFLIAGGIISGVGLGIVLEDALPGPQADGIVLLCIGLGFITIWAVERRHFWAAITGAILAALGLYEMTDEIAGMQEIARWWPVVLILLGVWLLLRRTRATGERG